MLKYGSTIINLRNLDHVESRWKYSVGWGETENKIAEAHVGPSLSELFL